LSRTRREVTADLDAFYTDIKIDFGILPDAFFDEESVKGYSFRVQAITGGVPVTAKAHLVGSIPGHPRRVLRGSIRRSGIGNPSCPARSLRRTGSNGDPSGSSPCITQCHLTAANVRLTGFHNALRDGSNCGVAVVTGRKRNCLAWASVTSDEPRKRGNRLVSHLCVGISSQNLNEISYNVGNADIFAAARLAGETVQSSLTDQRHGIVQSAAKGIRGNVACVMVQ
jgi:hypothetical protein